MDTEKMNETLRLLDQGLVMIHLDPRRDGVKVPLHLAEDPVLRLNIAYGFNLPSLEVDEEGVYAVLSFGGRNSGCWLPWPSIYAVSLPQQGHEGTLWPDDMPSEGDPLFASVGHLTGEGSSRGVSTSSSPSPLSVVEGEARADDDDEAPKPPPAKGAPHLRLVKG